MSKKSEVEVRHEISRLAMSRAVTYATARCEDEVRHREDDMGLKKGSLRFAVSVVSAACLPRGSGSIVYVDRVCVFVEFDGMAEAAHLPVCGHKDQYDEVIEVLFASLVGW